MSNEFEKLNVPELTEEQLHAVAAKVQASLTREYVRSRQDAVSMDELGDVCSEWISMRAGEFWDNFKKLYSSDPEVRAELNQVDIGYKAQLDPKVSEIFRDKMFLELDGLLETKEKKAA